MTASRPDSYLRRTSAAQIPSPFLGRWHACPHRARSVALILSAAAALTRVAAAGDIITREQFEDFELVLEWKVAPAGNSGIFFHVREDALLSHAYLSGPEMQVLDNEGHADGRDPLTSAGSNFALHAPIRDVTKKAGEWNEARLVVNGSHVEHWLNGVKLLEYELGSEEWSQSVANSKFKDRPEYGKARRGHIALQDHGDWVAFRNIRIRHN